MIKMLEYLKKYEYDELSTKNIVFLDAFKSSANNTLLKCISRNTPIFKSNHPAILNKYVLKSIYFEINYLIFLKSLLKKDL